MHKRMTITLDEEVYEGLRRSVGARKMSQFIEDLLRPHVLDQTMDEGYKAMAADVQREAKAAQWTQALGQDAARETR